MAIHGWMHVAVMGHWRDVLLEQLDLIETSGLRRATTRIRAIVVGEADPNATAWFPEWVEVVHRQDDLRLGETPTLLRLWVWARSHRVGKLWYIHTKGVSHDPGNLPVKDWRDLMNHYVITRWRECARALDGHDLCGVNFIRAGDPAFARAWGRTATHDHFSGNFWWARTDYLANLRPEKVELCDDRWQAELGFVAVGNPRVHCLHASGVNHYTTRYRPAL